MSMLIYGEIAPGCSLEITHRTVKGLRQRRKAGINPVPGKELIMWKQTLLWLIVTVALASSIAWAMQTGATWWFLLLIGLIVAEFWQRRQQSELAERLVRHYCARQSWQWISLARDESEWLPLLLRLLFKRSSCFMFEYTAQDDYVHQGALFLTGLRNPVFRDQATPVTSAQPDADNMMDDVSPSERADNVIPFPLSRRVTHHRNHHVD